MEYPLWLQVILALCMGLALAGLGAFLLYTFAIRHLRAALRLEDKRTHRETEALDTWREKYEEERADHVLDVADLTGRILILEKEAKIKDQLLAKVKVAEL